MIKVTFKTEEKIIEQVNFAEHNNSKKIDELKAAYDQKDVIKYELIFNESIKVFQTHDISTLGQKQIKEVIITIKDEQ